MLTLTFHASAKVPKEMCESNGRKEAMESLFSELLSVPVRLSFEIEEEQSQAADSSSPPKTSSQKRNEIVNNPAVKTVLMELDATITGIEEIND